MADIDTSNVTVGQPVEGGCVYTSFADNPAMPTDATTSMATLTDFESLGEISENGYTVSDSATPNKFNGWHGTVVLTTISNSEHTYKLEFIETIRPAVAKLKYGKDNVVATGDVISSINGKALDSIKVPLVIDELLSNGYKRRTVVPVASIDSYDDESHQKGNLLVFGMTFTAVDNPAGLFTQYIAKPAAS